MEGNPTAEVPRKLKTSRRDHDKYGVRLVKRRSRETTTQSFAAWRVWTRMTPPTIFTTKKCLRVDRPWMTRLDPLPRDNTNEIDIK